MDEHEARSFAACYERARQLVKPHRDSVKRKRRREHWWLFADQQAGLYDAIGRATRVLGITMTAMQFKFDWLPPDHIYDQTLVILVVEDDAVFAILHSSIHLEWAYEQGASFGSVAAPRYNPSRCYETYPLPRRRDPLMALGEQYHGHRHQLMLATQLGLTKTYNRFHDPDCGTWDAGWDAMLGEAWDGDYTSDDAITELRRLHVAMDYQVAQAYGWDDLQLDHGFHETKQGLRFTISEEARQEVLGRLLKLNHERCAEEVAQGLHDKKAKGKKGRRKKGTTKHTKDTKQKELF